MMHPQRDTPSLRLLRLWLLSAPIIMLSLSASFAIIAIIGQRWWMLATMLVLAIAAVGLFYVQARLLSRAQNE